MSKKYISLILAGDQYDYVYHPETRTVCTQMFPDVPVCRVSLNCLHSLSHDTLRDIVENKLKSYEMLADSF
ncbi:MAG: hypothetical protein EBU90_22615 [Proteobacteria bacterium]|nr:hypothetical protein [Pseudomonadota bacterium]